ncbi:MAG TPA: ABC transporter permease [Clostridia bacterium]|nr:ABC transporter permease [Clostridia bacterium]
MNYEYLFKKEDYKVTIFHKLEFFFRGAIYSYKSLFAWLVPKVYILTKVIGPIFQILFFTFLGQYYAKELGREFFIIGNAVQISALSSINGVAMTIVSERTEGTLLQLLGTPASRARIFVSRSLMHIIDGLLTVIIGFIFSYLFLGISFKNTNYILLVVTLLIAVFSTSGLGMLIGSIGLAIREINLLSNLTYFILLIFCGINYPVTNLPSFMQGISNLLPLTKGVEAVRMILQGANFTTVAPYLYHEIIIGVFYTLIGLILFKCLDYYSRYSGTLDFD